MTYRARLSLAFAVVALVPLAVIAIGVRREMDRRLTAQYQARVDALTSVTRAELARRSIAIGDRLGPLADALADDDRFRLAAVQGARDQRPYLLDWAGRAMRTTGFAMLQLQDSAGRILSSGHFRNEYDRLEPDLPALLASAPGGAALVRARTPTGPLLVLARVDSMDVGGRRFTLVGGIAVDDSLLRRLTPEGELAVSLVAPDSSAAADSARTRVVGELSFPFIMRSAADSRTLGEARFVITHPTTELDALRASVDRWFLATFVLTGVLALLAAAWLAARVSRPLTSLAERTARVDLDRLDVDFDLARDDEIGALSRLLAAMTRRLRTSAARVREAERRATVGDLARQVNHDVKNGLAPIRHVLRHLAQVEREEPERLAEVFAERRATLDASVAYLDTLARNYARLSPRFDLHPCDANAVAREVASGIAAPAGARIELRLDERLPRIASDALVLRRILENLVGNALDALEGGGGTVTIATEALSGGGARIVVRDSGSGMTREQLARAFDDFYTTKSGGTGLGLSVVRRLVADLHASLRIETAPGAGTDVIVTFGATDPAATPPPLGATPRKGAAAP